MLELIIVRPNSQLNKTTEAPLIFGQSCKKPHPYITSHDHHHNCHHTRHVPATKGSLRRPAADPGGKGRRGRDGRGAQPIKTTPGLPADQWTAWGASQKFFSFFS